MDKYDQLEKLKKLLDEGAISQSEYEVEKEQLLNKKSGSSKFWGLQEEEYCMFMHLSQFLGFMFPFAGLILPLIMWLTAKDDSEMVDNQGKNVINWIISSIVYLIACFILMFVFIGFFLFFVLFVIEIIFIIMAAVKARNGEVWVYPLSIPIFTVRKEI